MVQFDRNLLSFTSPCSINYEEVTVTGSKRPDMGLKEIIILIILIAKYLFDHWKILKI